MEQRSGTTPVLETPASDAIEESTPASNLGPFRRVPKSLIWRLVIGIAVVAGIALINAAMNLAEAEQAAGVGGV